MVAYEFDGYAYGYSEQICRYVEWLLRAKTKIYVALGKISMRMLMWVVKQLCYGMLYCDRRGKVALTLQSWY